MTARRFGFAHGAAAFAFLGVGVALLYASFFYLRETLREPSLDESRREEAERATWGSVPGQLDAITVRVAHVNRDMGSWHHVRAHYHYDVGGRRYQGDEGLGHYDSMDKVRHELERVEIALPRDKREEVKEDTFTSRVRLDTYPSAQPMRVFYDPRNPASSSVDGHPRHASRWVHVGNLLTGGFTVLSLALLGLAIIGIGGLFAVGFFGLRQGRVLDVVAPLLLRGVPLVLGPGLVALAFVVCFVNAWRPDYVPRAVLIETYALAGFLLLVGIGMTAFGVKIATMVRRGPAQAPTPPPEDPAATVAKPLSARD